MGWAEPAARTYAREHGSCASALVPLLLAIAAGAPPSSAAGQPLSAMPPATLELACTQGLPALASASARPRVLAEGPAAADLVIACSEPYGVRTLELTGVDASAWRRLQDAAARSRALRVVRLTESSRARARARREAAGAERYDLIVLAPGGASGEQGPLSAALPRVPSETAEGLSELMAALSSEGALFALLSGEAAALRFSLTAMQALREHGAARPSARIVVQRARDRYGVWVSPGPIAMDVLLQLHEHDRARREREALGAARDHAAWPAMVPTLLHTPVAMFPERFARTIHRHGAAEPPAQPPAYAFDIAPLHDERPLSFELTRRDRPDTWTKGGPFSRGLELLALVLAVWLVAALAAGRALRRSSASGFGLAASALLLGASHGTIACWATQAASLALADVRAGPIVALTSFAGGLGLALLGPADVVARRAPGLAALASLAFAGLAGLAWSWGDVVEALIGVPTVAVTPALVLLGAIAGAASALPARLALHAWARPDARAASAISYLIALAGSSVTSAVCVLFADFRTLGMAAAATGVAATLLSLHTTRALRAGVRE